MSKPAPNAQSNPDSMDNAEPATAIKRQHSDDLDTSKQTEPRESSECASEVPHFSHTKATEVSPETTADVPSESERDESRSVSPRRMVLAYFAALLMKAIVSVQRGEREILELIDFDTDMQACQSWLDAESVITSSVRRIRREIKNVLHILRCHFRRRTKAAAISSMDSHKPVLLRIGSATLHLDKTYNPTNQSHLSLSKSRPGLEIVVRTAVNDWRQRMNQYEPVNPFAVTYYTTIEEISAPYDISPYSQQTEDAAFSLFTLIGKVPGSDIMQVFLKVVKAHADAIMIGFRSSQVNWIDAVARASDLKHMVDVLRQPNSDISWQSAVFTELKEACLRFSFEFGNDPHHCDSLQGVHDGFAVVWSSLQQEFLRQLGAQVGPHYALLSGDRIREHMAARAAQIEDEMFIEFVGHGHGSNKHADT